MRKRLPIAACALVLGYNISWISKGVYWLVPFAVVLVVTLAFLVIRTPNTAPRRHPMKSAHSCRVCSRWLEGEWNRADSDAERDTLQALMDRGYCDKPGCEAEAARRKEAAR